MHTAGIIGVAMVREREIDAPGQDRNNTSGNNASAHDHPRVYSQHMNIQVGIVVR